MNDNPRSSKPPQAGAAGSGRPGSGRHAAGSNSDADPIAMGLQKLFGAVAEEPVPDEFMELLDRIEAAERERQTRESEQPSPSAGGRASR
jgi:hypothetical protein